MSLTTFLSSSAALLLAVSGALAPAELEAQRTAEAELKDPDGQRVGRVTLREAPRGVHLDVRLEGVEPGVHAIHVHETGACSPDFEAAGDHLAGPGVAHGLLSEDGHHAGDLPNLHVPSGGGIRVELFASRLSLEGSDRGGVPVFDDDGAAVVVHEDADDHRTDPAGKAGDRVACGVIR